MDEFFFGYRISNRALRKSILSRLQDFEEATRIRGTKDDPTRRRCDGTVQRAKSRYNMGRSLKLDELQMKQKVKIPIAILSYTMGTVYRQKKIGLVDETNVNIHLPAPDSPFHDP